MEIRESKDGDVLVLQISGKLDASTSKTLENKILADIDSGHQKLLIDLSQLEYISSSGLRVLLLAAKRLSSRQGKFVLCSLKENVRQVFDICRLFLDFFDLCLA